MSTKTAHADLTFKIAYFCEIIIFNLKVLTFEK
jgi:hypothetical protein